LRTHGLCQINFNRFADGIDIECDKFGRYLIRLNKLKNKTRKIK